MTKPALPAASRKKGFWTPVRLAATFAVFALITAFMLPGCGSSTDIARPNTTNANAPVASSNSATAPPASAKPLEPALLNTELKDLEGKSFKLSDYSGKVLIVNMWATWCGPCRQEMPELVQLHKDYKSKGLEVVGLATAQNDPDLEAVKDFIKEQKVDYKVVYDNGMLASALTQMTNARSVIPQNFIISRDGRIVGHFQGFSPIATPPKLRDAVEKALGESKG